MVHDHICFESPHSDTICICRELKKARDEQRRLLVMEHNRLVGEYERELRNAYADGVESGYQQARAYYDDDYY